MKKNKVFLLLGLVFFITVSGLLVSRNLSNSGIKASEGIKLETTKEEVTIGDSFQLTLNEPAVLKTVNEEGTQSIEKQETIIPLPEGVSFNEQLTNQANNGQIDSNVSWNEEKRQIEVAWVTQQNLNQVQLVINGDTEGLYTIEASRLIEGMTEVSNKLVVSVTAPQASKEVEAHTDSTALTVADEDEATATIESSESEVENNSNTVENQEETKAVVPTNEERSNSPTPRIGNLNMDVDIAPVSTTVLAGQTGVYELNLKTTGAMSNYKNVKLVVALPQNAGFKQDLNELKIAGTLPTYDNSLGTLTYNFSELVTGQAYKLFINVIPENGFTLNGSQLVASVALEADGFSKVTDTAQITVNATTPVSVTKSYVGVKDKDATLGAVPGDTVIWKIKASINSKETGLLFLKPDSAITISDAFVTGLTYSGTTASVVPTQAGSTQTWTFKAPNLEAQQAALKNETDIWSVEFLVYTKVANSVPAYTNLTNFVNINSTDFGNITGTKKSNNAAFQVVKEGTDVPPTGGTWIYPMYLGPNNNNLEGRPLNPVPTVTDSAKLDFLYQYYLSPASQTVYKEKGKTNLYDWNNLEVYKKGYKNLSIHEEIDPNLELYWLGIPKPRGRAVSTEDVALKQMPTLTIKLQVNTIGNWKSIEVDTLEYITSNKLAFFRSDMGLKDTDHVISYELFYKNKDNTPIQGNFMLNPVESSFHIKKGYTGKVTNQLWYSGWVDGAASAFYKFPENNSVDSTIGPRSANVVRPTNTTPVTRNTIYFQKKDGNKVNLGTNRISAQMHNDSSSMVRMTKDFSGSIILPLGVTINENSNIAIWDGKGVNTGLTGGSYIVQNNYNGTGRQKIIVKWNDAELFPGKNLAFDFDVTIARNAEMPLELYLYTTSGDTKVSVPVFTQPNITNSTLEIDTDDINEDGNKTQQRVKSGNNYVLKNEADVQTEKMVKGDQDTEYSKFGHTTPGGMIDYRLKVTNTTAENISKFVLMDVLPSVGDLTLTDGVSRGSMFTPNMTGPITVPTEWADKVTVLYSTATNPKRDDLVKNVVYPETTQKLQNPSGATDPNWTLATNITDWSKIHSYKIELNTDVSVVPGQNIVLDFRMKAPEESSITNKSLVDPTVNEQTRAAWNSFAYASNTLQAVEPERVGVVMNGLEGKVSLQKVDSDDTKMTLSGAKFVIAATDSDLQAGLYIKKEASGKLIYPKDAGYSANLENYEVTSDSKGIVLFDSLRLDESNGKTYYIKETQAPTGYQLSNIGIQVLASVEVNPVSIQIKNTKKVVMPQTGSMRVVLCILLGAGLVGTGVVRYINTNKQGEKKQVQKAGRKMKNQKK